MINEKIILSLLFCMPNIFGMQASVSNVKKMKNDTDFDFIHMDKTSNGTTISYCYKNGEVLPVNINFPYLASIGLVQCDSISGTANQNNSISGLQNSNRKQGKNLSIGNSQINASMPLADAAKLVYCGAQWLYIQLGNLIQSHKTPKDVLKREREIKSIIGNDQNSTEFKSFRSELNKEFKLEMDQFLEQNGCYPKVSTQDLRCKIFLLMAENILLNNDITNLYKSYNNSYIKKEILYNLAISEEKLAQNNAAIKILSELLNKVNNKINEKSSSNKNTVNENSDYEIKLNIFLRSRFTITDNGFSTVDLIKGVKRKNKEEYKKDVQDKVQERVNEKLLALAKDLDSSIDSLSLEQLKKLALSLSEAIEGLKQESAGLEKTRNSLYDEYYDTYKIEATRNILGVSEKNYYTNELKKEVLVNSLSKIKAAIIAKEKEDREKQKSPETQQSTPKQEQKNIDSSDKKTDITTTQSQKNFETANISIPIDSKTTVQIPIAQIQKQSLSDAKIIAQGNVNTETSYNSETTESSKETIFFYDGLKENMEERKVAAENDIKNGNACNTQNYVLSKELTQALINIGLNPNNLVKLTGTESQQVTQQQLINAGEALALNHLNLGPDLTSLGLNFISIANTYNATGNVIKANSLIDSGNVLLDIGKGIVKGGINVINPVRIVQGYAFIAQQVVQIGTTFELLTLKGLTNSKLVQSLPLIGEYAKKIDDRTAEVLLKQYYDLKTNLSNLKDAWDKKDKHQKIELITSIAIEALLSGKVQKCYMNFLGKQIPKIKNVASTGLDAIKKGGTLEDAEQAILSTPEGIEVKLAQETLNTMDKVKNKERILTQNETLALEKLKSPERFSEFKKYIENIPGIIIDKGVKIKVDTNFLIEKYGERLIKLGLEKNSLSTDFIQHIINGHSPVGADYLHSLIAYGKIESIFNLDENFIELILTTLEKGTKVSKDRFVYDFGRVIGLDSMGIPTTKMAVVLMGLLDKLKTAFPK